MPLRLALFAIEAFCLFVTDNSSIGDAQVRRCRSRLPIAMLFSCRDGIIMDRLRAERGRRRGGINVIAKVIPPRRDLVSLALLLPAFYVVDRPPLTLSNRICELSVAEKRTRFKTERRIVRLGKRRGYVRSVNLRNIHFSGVTFSSSKEDILGKFQVNLTRNSRSHRLQLT